MGILISSNSTESQCKQAAKRHAGYIAIAKRLSDCVSDISSFLRKHIRVKLRALSNSSRRDERTRTLS